MVLAHLEPELELFEVDDIGNDGDDDDDDLSLHHLPNKQLEENIFFKKAGDEMSVLGA